MNVRELHQYVRRLFPDSEILCSSRQSAHSLPGRDPLLIDKTVITVTGGGAGHQRFEAETCQAAYTSILERDLATAISDGDLG